VLTRLLTSRGLYSRARGSDLAEQLHRCALTALTLENAGVELLVRPERWGQGAAQASRVEYLGTEPLDEVKAHHFKLLWQGGKDVELWIAAEGKPLVRRFIRSIIVPLEDRTTVRVTTTSTLTWKVGEALPGDAFAVTLPKGAREVEDLHAALLVDAPEVRAGRPAVALELPRLTGGDFRLADHKGKDAVVLYFWAGWSAASVEDIPGLNQLMKAHAGKGVSWYAVNVGEKAEQVKAFVARSRIAAEVLLDPDGKATDAFDVTDIPLAVLIDREGTVRAVVPARGREGREQVRKKIEALSSTQQRP
jgi:peroxiredoxin